MAETNLLDSSLLGSTPLDSSSVTARMQRLIEAWRTTEDTRHVFLHCYWLMTSNVLAALDQGEFQDPVWVRQLLNNFARYYFVALDAYEQNVDNAPQVWRITHQAATQPDLLVIQNLMLGVNAHINYDLVLALVEMLETEWPHLSPQQRQARYADHCYINQIIGSTIDTVQDEVICRLAPAFSLLDQALGPVDEWITRRLIALWRETVWSHALRMLACQAANEREALRLEVEQMTLARANKILLTDTCVRLRALL